MKKVNTLLFVLLLGIAFRGFSQTTPQTDFYAEKWEITIVGTPEGDSKMVTELTRKDGKLTGALKDPTGKRTEVTPITKIEETNTYLTIYFDTAQAGEIPIELKKVNDDHLKGSLMNMFDASAIRVEN